jgi:hypothetical protein
MISQLNGAVPGVLLEKSCCHGSRFSELAQNAVLMTRKKCARSPLQLAMWYIGALADNRAELSLYSTGGAVIRGQAGVRSATDLDKGPRLDMSFGRKYSVMEP